MCRVNAKLKWLWFLCQVRWKFTDLTHGSQLTVKILELLPWHENNRCHRVELVNHSKSGEPFEVGSIITALALPSNKAQQVLVCVCVCVCARVCAAITENLRAWLFNNSDFCNLYF